MAHWMLLRVTLYIFYTFSNKQSRHSNQQRLSDAVWNPFSKSCNLILLKSDEIFSKTFSRVFGDFKGIIFSSCVFSRVFIFLFTIFQASNLNRNQQCTSNDALNYLLEDLFMGHELIPDVLDKPPLYPLELTYKTIRTYPGMKLTADLTRFKPMLHWPANRNSIYTVVMSNLDINNRKNRYVHKYIFKKK